MIMVVGLLLYFLPSIIAHRRKHKNEHTITIVNVLAGWTGIGWVLLLVWACSEPWVPTDSYLQSVPHFLGCRGRRYTPIIPRMLPRSSSKPVGIGLLTLIVLFTMFSASAPNGGFFKSRQLREEASAYF